MHKLQLYSHVIIHWTKTGMRDITMCDAVNDYLEASGANSLFIGGEETILAHRKIAANRRTKHGQSVERCSNTMPCKEEEEDTQPTNEAWAEYRAMLEHYAMQGGGRGHSTDERSMGRVLSDARILCHARRKRTLNRLAIDSIYA